MYGFHCQSFYMVFISGSYKDTKTDMFYLFIIRLSERKSEKVPGLFPVTGRGRTNGRIRNWNLWGCPHDSMRELSEEEVRNLEGFPHVSAVGAHLLCDITRGLGVQLLCRWHIWHTGWGRCHTAAWVWHTYCTYWLGVVGTVWRIRCQLRGSNGCTVYCLEVKPFEGPLFQILLCVCVEDIFYICSLRSKF